MSDKFNEADRTMIEDAFCSYVFSKLKIGATIEDLQYIDKRLREILEKVNKNMEK